MTLLIRTMTQDDIDKVYAIELAAHRSPWTRQIIHDCVSIGYDCQVLELKKKNIKSLIGYMICRENLNFFHILNLCIIPSEQGKGYGKLMMQAIMKVLETRLVTTIVLEVRPSNLAAIKLYQSLGFRQDAIKKAYYNDENGIEDALVFKKIIKKRFRGQLENR